MSRVKTALLLLPPLLAIILFAPAWAFLLLAEVMALLGVRELFELAEPIGYRAFRSLAYLATLFLTASFYPGLPATGWIVLAFVLTVGLAGLMIGTLVGVRLIEPEVTGRHWVLFLLAVIMTGDSGAYYIGRWRGRRRLAPSVSPNKTVEGLVGGVAASVVAALVAARLLLPNLGPLHAAALGAVLSLIGVAGDLFESLLKRSAGVKNSSNLFPGHGGVLDRLDSLYFSAPVLFAYLRLASG